MKNEENGKVLFPDIGNWFVLAVYSNHPEMGKITISNVIFKIILLLVLKRKMVVWCGWL